MNSKKKKMMTTMCLIAGITYTYKVVWVEIRSHLFTDAYCLRTYSFSIGDWRTSCLYTWFNVPMISTIDVVI